MNPLCLQVDLGKAATWDISVTTAAGAPLALPPGTHAWLTVKLNASDDDAAALFILTEADGEGITFVDRDSGFIAARATAVQTALLNELAAFTVELQIQLPDGDAELAARGTLTGRQAATHAPDVSP